MIRYTGDEAAWMDGSNHGDGRRGCGWRQDEQDTGARAMMASVSWGVGPAGCRAAN